MVFFFLTCLVSLWPFAYVTLSSSGHVGMRSIPSSVYITLTKKVDEQIFDAGLNECLTFSITYKVHGEVLNGQFGSQMLWGI